MIPSLLCAPACITGPDISDGTFKPVSIKSIHYKRLPVTQVVAGQTAAMALKKLKRNQVGARCLGCEFQLMGSGFSEGWGLTAAMALKRLESHESRGLGAAQEKPGQCALLRRGLQIDFSLGVFATACHCRCARAWCWWMSVSTPSPAGSSTPTSPYSHTPPPSSRATRCACRGCCGARTGKVGGRTRT